MITGDIQNEGNGGVQIEVSGPNGAVFGPQWIQTKSDVRTGAGDFTQQVTVTTVGNYKVDFSDSNGFIGEKVFTVVSSATAPTAVATSSYSSSCKDDPPGHDAAHAMADRHAAITPPVSITRLSHCPVRASWQVCQRAGNNFPYVPVNIPGNPFSLGHGMGNNLLCRNHWELLTLQGLRPARLWHPGCDSAVLPVYKKCERGFCTGNNEASYAPPPLTGAGMAQGGQSYL